MNDQMLVQIRQIIFNKPYLAWSTKDYDSLSAQAVFEDVLNFGDWDDFLRFTEIVGMQESARLFDEIKNKKRSNLKPLAVNYFTHFFNHYA